MVPDPSRRQMPESAATVRQYFTSFVIRAARATRRRTNSGAVTMMLRLLTAAEADDKAIHTQIGWRTYALTYFALGRARSDRH